MKIEHCAAAVACAAALMAALPGISATLPDTPGIPAQMVITSRPAKGVVEPANLKAGDLTVVEGNARVPIVRLDRLSGGMANMQLFVLLDDSTRSSSLGIHLPELKKFLASLPATTQVAVGYMRNGTFALTQAFTTDHQQAANSLRLPIAVPGMNGSPYFVLSDLSKHWPSKESTGRRAVLMLTDGIDRYWNTYDMDDPYVHAAMHDALKDGVMVYSIYLRGAGLYGRGGWVQNFAQSQLIQVAEETGGNAYFEAFTDPVTVAPFLSDLQDRLANQYRVTVDANQKGIQPVKLRTEMPGVKIDAPTRIYVP